MKITITDLQRKTGDVTTALVRGEQIIVTKNGKPFALITPIDNAKPKVEKKPVVSPAVDQYVDEPEDEYPQYYLGKPLSGNKGTCPICQEIAPVEFAQQHYLKKHGEI